MDALEIARPRDCGASLREIAAKVEPLIPIEQRKEGFEVWSEPSTPKVSKITIHELLEALKADYTRRGKTSARNLSVLKRADADFGTYRAVDLSADELAQRLADLPPNTPAEEALRRAGGVAQRGRNTRPGGQDSGPTRTMELLARQSA